MKVKPKASEKLENSVFIKNFEKELRFEKFATTTSNADLSTIKKYMGHLFFYEDSFLEYWSKIIPNFNLGQLCDLSGEEFKELTDPTGDWVRATGGESGKEQPSRRKEQLKSHARLRDFVINQIERISGSNVELMLKKELVLKNLKEIGLKIIKKKVFYQLEKLIAQNRLEKEKSRKVINPSQDYLEEHIVESWFKSAEAKLEERECKMIYDKAMTTKKIGLRDFTRFANWARFGLVLVDRNRRSSYNFTNMDFDSRIPKWLPVVDENSNLDLIERFEMMSADWDPNKAPTEGLAPTVWVIQLCGNEEGLKGGNILS